MKKIFTLAALMLAFAQGNAMDYSNPSNNNYVSEWGHLKLVGNQLSSESGQPVQLRGWSTHGKQWQGSCFDDKTDFELMKSKGANLARIANYVNEGGGSDVSWVEDCIKWTNELGMYCLVDWHILTPGNPNNSDYSGYSDFFSQISKFVADGGYKNVLYEICNEPNIDEEGDPYRPDVWKWVKKYANKCLPIISANDPNAVVIVGTPQWDKALSCPMEDPITIPEGLNVMYTFHHYACDQQFYLGILSGAAGSIPVFVTEWADTNADGGEDNNTCSEYGDKMLNVCNGKNLGNQVISWAAWSWSQDWRSSSAFTSGGYPNSMSTAGNYIAGKLKEGDNFTSSTSTPYESTVPTFDGNNDLILALEKYDKGGQDEAFYDFDRSDWGWCAACNYGDYGTDGGRTDGNVDLGYTDKNNKETCYKNIGYIVNGEWVKYTIDVKKAGVYEFELYTCNHIDNNIVAISVDGENALVNDAEGTKDNVRAFQMQPCNGGVSDGGYDDWGWTSAGVNSDFSDEEGTKFYINFKKAGQQTLAFAFLTANSGLGAFKLVGKDPSSVANMAAENNKVAIWPNPSADGNFNVSVKDDSEVKVMNMQGDVVMIKNVEAGSQTVISIPNSGVYSVSVASDSDLITKKLIVK